METEGPDPTGAAMRRTSSGSTPSIGVDEELREFDHVLESIISPNDKKAYLKATDKCPELVQTESKPLLFLRRHDFHVWNAVQAFIGYWEARLEVFGEERAFLPLNLTGQGALTPDDITALKSCYTTLLPEHQSGAPVIMCCAQNAPATRQDCVARTFFYIRNVAAMNPLAQTQGYFGIIRYSAAWRQMTASSGMRLGMAALECLPIAVRHLIVIAQPDEFEDARHHMKAMAEKNSVFKRMNLVADYEDGELIQKLEAHGFSRTCLPMCMGGHLNMDQAIGWMEKFKNGLKEGDYFVSTRDSVASRLATKPSLKGGTKAEWGLRVLEETLHFMADNEEKDAYLEAIEIAPELVEAESNPKKFLQSVDFDGWAAAHKLCKYWYFRKKWFGRKAFHPMTINGKGALSPDDFEIVQQGMMQILPPDNQGRTVFALRSTGTPKGAAVMRVTFYFMQKLADIEASRTIGIVFLAHFVGEDGYIDGNKWTEALEFGRNGAAVRLQKTFLLGQEGSISMSRGQALKQVFSGAPELIELVDDSAENLSRMLSVGFSKAGTPTELGGTWSKSDFLSWLDQQLTQEENRDFTLYDEALGRVLPANVPPDTKTTNPRGTAEEMTLLVAMEQALKAMDKEETDELFDARRVVPDLFATESPPLRFLRAVEFDPLKAAKRIAAYWKRRRNLFGARAFLPLQMSKQGALDDKAIRIIKSGEMALLPEDKCGRPVLLFSREPYHGRAGTLDARMQTLFYLLQVASENQRSQTEGVVALRKWVPSLFSTSRFKEIIEVGSTSLPVQFYSHHLICLVPPSGQRSYLESITSRIYNFSNYFMTGTTSVHLTGVGGELNSELLQFDLRQECLPKSVGGLWDEVDDLRKWIQGREAKEQKLSRKMFPSGVPKEKTEDTVAETAQSKETALQALEEAIGLMADEEKKDYLEAKRVVPHLVLKESNPMSFIRCEKWNTWAAARRVAFYWKKRKEYFGSRAHLPMNQSGEGALSKEDVALLSTGYICLLPRDAKGRDVVCHDASRKPPGMLERRLRVLFYMGNIMAENKKNQTEGSRFLVVLTKISLDGGFSKIMEIAKEVLPSLTFDVHIIHVPGESSKTTFLEKIVPPMLQILGSFLEDKTVVHTNETKSALIERLESYDLERSGLPGTVGGKWTYDQFYYWQEARIRMEWDLPLSAAQRKLVFGGDTYTCRGLSQLSEEEKIERKRRLNLLHSRRKREKEKVEIEVLKSQVSRLEDEKHEGNIEHARLQKLMEDALGIVGQTFRQQHSNMTDASSTRGILANEAYGGTAVNHPNPSPSNGYDQFGNSVVLNVYSMRQPGDRNAHARAYEAAGPHHGNSPQMAAMNPQSPDTVRLQHMIMSGNLQQQRMQPYQQRRQQQPYFQGMNLHARHMSNVMAPSSLDHFGSQAPVPGFASGASRFDTNNLFSSNLSQQQQQQQQQQQYMHQELQNRQSASQSTDAALYAMRLDPNRPVKRQRY